MKKISKRRYHHKQGTTTVRQAEAHQIFISQAYRIKLTRVTDSWLLFEENYQECIPYKQARHGRSSVTRINRGHQRTQTLKLKIHLRLDTSNTQLTTQSTRLKLQTLSRMQNHKMPATLAHGTQVFPSEILPSPHPFYHQHSRHRFKRILNHRWTAFSNQ